jgi:hypothetical protein
MEYRKRVSADPPLNTRTTNVPLAGRQSIRRKPPRTRYDHTALQAVPEDALATPEGENRTAGGDDHGAFQTNNSRDATTSSSTPPAMEGSSASTVRVSYYSLSHHDPLNSEGDCEPLSPPTSIGTNTARRPPVPPKPPSLTAPRLGHSSADRHHAIPTSASSTSEQDSASISPAPFEGLSPTPALNPLPTLQQPTHPPLYTEEVALLQSLLEAIRGMRRVDGGDFERRLPEKIDAARDESDLTASWFTSLYLDEFPSALEKQDHALRLPTPDTPNAVEVANQRALSLRGLSLDEEEGVNGSLRLSTLPPGLAAITRNPRYALPILCFVSVFTLNHFLRFAVYMIGQPASTTAGAESVSLPPPESDDVPPSYNEAAECISIFIDCYALQAIQETSECFSVQFLEKVIAAQRDQVQFQGSPSDARHPLPQPITPPAQTAPSPLPPLPLPVRSNSRRPENVEVGFVHHRGSITLPMLQSTLDQVDATPNHNATVEEPLHVDELGVPGRRRLSRVERALLRVAEFGSEDDLYA